MYYVGTELSRDAAWAAERQKLIAVLSIIRTYWVVFGIRFVLHGAKILNKSASSKCALTVQQVRLFE